MGFRLWYASESPIDLFKILVPGYHVQSFYFCWCGLLLKHLYFYRTFTHIDFPYLPCSLLFFFSILSFFKFVFIIFWTESYSVIQAGVQ